MERDEYLRRFWQGPDSGQAVLLRRLEGRRTTLELGLQRVLDQAARLGFDGRLPDGERRLVDAAIAALQLDELEPCRPVAALLRPLPANPPRRDVLETAFLLEWLLFFDDVERLATGQFTETVREQAAFLQAPREISPARVKEWLRQPCVDGALFDAELQARALYAARQLTRAAEAMWRQQRPLTLAAPPVRGFLDREEAWLLRPLSKGGHAGFLDAVMTNLVGHTVLQAFAARGVRRVEFVAVLDAVTTAACRALHGAQFDLDELVLGRNAPPIFPPPHPCRSALRVVAWEGLR